jgi:hypothetical protein
MLVWDSNSINKLFQKWIHKTEPHSIRNYIPFTDWRKFPRLNEHNFLPPFEYIGICYENDFVDSTLRSSLIIVSRCSLGCTRCRCCLLDFLNQRFLGTGLQKLISNHPWLIKVEPNFLVHEHFVLYCLLYLGIRELIQSDHGHRKGFTNLLHNWELH